MGNVYGTYTERIGTYNNFTESREGCTERIGTYNFATQFPIIARGLHGTYRNVHPPDTCFTKQAGEPATVRLLLDWQADLNSQDKQGCRPMDKADYWYMKGLLDQHSALGRRPRRSAREFLLLPNVWECIQAVGTYTDSIGSVHGTYWNVYGMYRMSCQRRENE